jgi:hypothetical protein
LSSAYKPKAFLVLLSNFDGRRVFSVHKSATDAIRRRFFSPAPSCNPDRNLSIKTIRNLPTRFFGKQDIIISTFQSPSKQIYPSGMFWRSDSPAPLDKASPEETETPCGWDEDQIQMQLAEKLPGIANAFVSSSPADSDINESSPSSLDELETYIHDLLDILLLLNAVTLAVIS